MPPIFETFLCGLVVVLAAATGYYRSQARARQTGDGEQVKKLRASLRLLVNMAARIEPSRLPLGSTDVLEEARAGLAKSAGSGPRGKWCWSAGFENSSR